jgi:hypothetical protein
MVSGFDAMERTVRSKHPPSRKDDVDGDRANHTRHPAIAG